MSEQFDITRERDPNYTPGHVGALIPCSTIVGRPSVVSLEHLGGGFEVLFASLTACIVLSFRFAFT